MADVALDLAFTGSASGTAFLQSPPIGPWLFAWVDPEETEFQPEHVRLDEDMFSFELEHNEGDFATLQISIRNPRIGLLTASRKRWAWFAFNPGEGADIIPVFFGRIVGIPSDLISEVCTIQFIGRPADYVAQKDALAATMRVAPYWDDIFVSEERRIDPEVVLEGRPEFWHIDRVTGVLTSSNVLVGEDGLIEFDEDNVMGDSVEINLNNVPLRSVTVVADISWTQSARGVVNMGPFLVDNWPQPSGFTFHRFLTSFTGQGLQSSWPKPEQSIGGGWTVKDAKVDYVAGQAVPNEFEALELNHGILIPKATPAGSLIIPVINGLDAYQYFAMTIIAPLWHFKPTLTVEYDATRARKEVVTFTINSSVQDVVTMPGEDEALLVTMSSIDISQPIDPLVPNVLWIADKRDRSFIPSERGQQALQYLIQVGRANLMIRSRVVEIDWETQFENIFDMSCRKNAKIIDPRIPGGEATGKVVTYGLSKQENSAPIGYVKIACPVGYGDAIATAPGSPTYIEDDYIELGYYERTGEIIAVGAGDVGYTVPLDDPQDDGIDFKRGFRPIEIITHFSVTGAPSTQRAAMLSAKAEPNTRLEEGTVKEKLQTVPTVVTMQLIDLLTGPFETPYEIVVTDLVLPAGIDLEASA